MTFPRRAALVLAALAPALVVAPSAWAAPPPPGPACMTVEHVFVHEDAAGVFLDPGHTGQQELDLQVEAANAVIAEHGDRFDFFLFFTAFTPGVKFGGAHYIHVRNDATGIGLATFDNHATFGLDGTRAQGLVTMYDFHVEDTARAGNALSHEVGHRWVAYLAPLPDGRVVANGHFDCRIDLQGGPHGAEWRGDPAHPQALRLNADTGGRYGWLVLYLAGLASAAEVDALMSEQRYMDDVDELAGGCLETYDGPQSSWSSADVIATNGPRTPGPEASQSDFATAWVLFTAPGEEASAQELARLARLAERFMADWPRDTAGRSTLTGRLFDDCDCDGVPDGDDPDGCP